MGRPPIQVDETDPRYRRIAERHEERLAVEARAKTEVDAARRDEWVQAVIEVDAGLPVIAAAHALGVRQETASRGLRDARSYPRPTGAIR